MPTRLVRTSEVANHLQDYAPDASFITANVGAWNPWPYFEWIQPWDPWDMFEPGWDGERGEASTLILGYDDHFARILRSGEAMVVDDSLGAGLKSLMLSRAVWGPAGEASLAQAYQGPHQAPHAIAFHPDGTDVYDGAWLESGVRGSASDVGEPSLARTGGPPARADFLPVYSRADDLAFVVGGHDRGSPTGDIWVRSVVETGVPWMPIPLAAGYSPNTVRAATWSPREEKLWVLDEDGQGVARLARVHPWTGHVDILVETTWSRTFDRHWMRLSLDGRVLLFASSSDEGRHGVALFDFEPMVTWSDVTIDALQFGDNELMYRPNVDPRGITFVTDDGGGRAVVVRQDGVDGSPALLSEVERLL